MRSFVCLHRCRSLRLLAATVAAVVLGVGVGVSSASAAPSLSMSIDPPTPKPGEFLTIAQAGTADGPGFVSTYLQDASTSNTCAATPGEEKGRRGGLIQPSPESNGVSAPGEFHFKVHLVAAPSTPGSYLLCGYLMMTPKDASAPPTVAASAMTAFTIPSPPPQPAPAPAQPPTSPTQPTPGLSPPTLTVVGGSIAGTVATIRLNCQGAAGQVCSATAVLSSNVRLIGSKAVAVSARKRAKSTNKRIIAAIVKYSAPAGTSTTIKLSLNAVAGRLLGHLGRLPTTLSLNGIAITSVIFNHKQTKKKPRKPKKAPSSSSGSLTLAP